MGRVLWVDCPPPPPGYAGSHQSVGLRSSPVPDRRTPLNLTGERETLLEFLDYLRESVILKVEDLDEESARKSTVPTGTSLLGLVKHLTGVEVVWFQFAFVGLDPLIPTEVIEPTDTVEGGASGVQIARPSPQPLQDFWNCSALTAGGTQSWRFSV